MRQVFGRSFAGLWLLLRCFCVLEMATGGEILLDKDGPQDNQGLAKDNGDAEDIADATADVSPGVTAEVPLHVRYPGVTAEQFQEWRRAFNARVMAGKHANLKTQADLDIIVDLLGRWDQLRCTDRRAISGACDQWKKKYTVGSDGLLLAGNRICVPREELFDYLVPYHFANQHAKGRGLWKRVKPRLHHVTEKVCHALCEDCPVCLAEKEQKKPRAGTQPIITHGMNKRGQVDLIDMQSLGNDTFRWCCTYQDHGLKDMYVAPLRGKTMLEVAHNLLQIFAILGVPLILHTDNGREFASLAGMTQVTGYGDWLCSHTKCALIATLPCRCPSAMGRWISSSRTLKTCGPTRSWSRGGLATANPKVGSSA